MIIIDDDKQTNIINNNKEFLFKTAYNVIYTNDYDNYLKLSKTLYTLFQSIYTSFLKTNSASLQINSYIKEILNYGSNVRIPDTQKTLLLNKLGIKSSVDILVTTSCSNSMSLILLYLKSKNIKTVYVLDSAYFVVEKLCKIFNIKIVYIDLNELDILTKQYENCALWITQPLLCTSKILTQTDINRILTIIKKYNIYTIFDECLSLKTCNLIENNIEINDLTLFIESPFKTICINGILKTSFLIASQKTFNEIYKLSLTHIYSYYYANLDNVVNSINFFISKYYDKYYNYINTIMNTNFNKIKKLIENKTNVVMDNQYESQYIALYVKTNPNANICYDKLCKDILINTHCNIIPNQAQYKNLFTFRVHLVAENENLEVILNTLIDYISNYK